QYSMLNSQWKARLLFPLATCFLLLASCSLQKKIAKSANKDLLNVAALQTAHVGISIYEAATNKFWYDYQGDKYFVPASNTKIPTCYAAMKYLGDSLVGLKYVTLGKNNNTDIWVQATGDPTLLHPDFVKQPVIEFFKKDTAVLFTLATNGQWKDNAYGSGWSWNDYDASYMAERSLFPVYGNVIRFYGKNDGINIIPANIEMGYSGIVAASPFSLQKKKYSFSRARDKNLFLWQDTEGDLKYEEIPFITSEMKTIELLQDTVRGLKLTLSSNISLTNPKLIYSQPTDSLLKPMMHRSDNFFAEQSLLMVSNEVLGMMNDAKIIDTLLKTDLKGLPQRPGWVDGSGLSRYNLFTPQDFVFILNKMKNEFGMERIKTILPTGGEGTISNYYKTDSGFIYVKTGTLSGVVALSGFLYTKKGKQLIFSILVNNHQAPATDVRRAMEKFLQGVRNKY
ncbi:MAG: D-alanyl-D-alanine carboxypeptidase/D-alanyl-D-alanine-endopeptidase, partial [Chitinophagaceae bacterium]